ncbi:restriction endonuclease subunit S [Iodobacter sp. LRB]|uniref:restriction endonuclease subunit S n=1 Tax=unclassified Iodobacter TaxID=235634 RepID=UPI000C0F519C|nr:restriction endonuclease subunit S [Iodobacter sp. BJB302]PHV00884.1 restriction endonuclease subunit S [Iodobacter sp. BJB302]
MTFELTTIGQYASVQGGYAFKSQDFLSSGFLPVLKIKNVRHGYVDYGDTTYVSEQVAASCDKWETVTGDVLISMTGSGPSAPESLVGRVARVWNSEPTALINQRVGRLILKQKDAIDKDFLFYVLSQKESQEYLVSNSTGSANQVNISGKTIESVACPIVTLEESQEIAGFLRAFDQRIRLLRETNATLEAMAQALFKSWFVDFDPVYANASTKQMINPASSPSDFVGDPGVPLDSRLRGNDDLLPPELQTLFPATFTASPQGLVPEGWEWQALDEAYELNPKRNLKKGVLAKYLDMASVGTSGHTAESAINREFGSGTKFINGDTLLARITPCLENGKTAFVDFLEEDETGWGSTEFIVMRPKTPLPPYHAYLLSRFPAFREFAIQSMSGTSGRQRVQNDVLGRYMLAVPDAAVAEVFGQSVGVIQQKIQANHQQAQTLATLRDTLLPRLISGQLRLPDADAMQAEVCDV